MKLSDLLKVVKLSNGNLLLFGSIPFDSDNEYTLYYGCIDEVPYDFLNYIVESIDVNSYGDLSVKINEC